MYSIAITTYPVTRSHITLDGAPVLVAPAYNTKNEDIIPPTTPLLVREWCADHMLVGFGTLECCAIHKARLHILYQGLDFDTAMAVYAAKEE